MKLKLEDMTSSQINEFFKTATIGSILFFVVLIGAIRIILGYNPFPLHSGSPNRVFRKDGIIN